MVYWSVKYIESRGIDTFEGVLDPSEPKYVKSVNAKQHRYERLGKDVFETEQEAILAGIEKLNRGRHKLKVMDARWASLIKNLEKRLERFDL